MARTAYNPGTPTVPTRIGPGLYSIDSFREEGVAYTVNLHTGGCTCPHFTGRLLGTGQECKHLKACRAARFEELVATAKAATTADLNRLLIKHESNGNLDVAVAIRSELHDRLQAVGA